VLPGRPLDVGPANALPRRGRLVVSPPGLGTSVLLIRTWRAVYAVENRCPHQAMPLDDGRVRGATIVCAAHGRQFDLRTGTCLSRVADPARTWVAWLSAGRIWLLAS
jgi:nitrite reductase/ring-hydroxylating ferredoxin subunit